MTCSDAVMRTWCDVDLDNLDHNVNAVRERTEKQIIAVVKGDAYGHGDHQICRALKQLGITFFAVANLAEAASLRQSGLKGDILILGYTPVNCARQLQQLHCIQTIYDLAYARALHNAIKPMGTQLRVHVKVDTGMHRLGFLVAEARQAIMQLSELTAFSIEGIYTHFSHADGLEKDAVAYTNGQQQAFESLLVQLQQDGISFEWVHSQNSPGFITQNPACCNAVRLGLLLYGIDPELEMAGGMSLKPILSLRSVVSMLKTVPAGSAISYARTYVTSKPTRIATLPIGYADGYSRRLSSKAEVLVGGIRCPVVGRVCMDQIMVDVTAVENVAVGQMVTVFGGGEGQCPTAQELALLCDTVPHEILCSISRRVPRVYYQNGEMVTMTNYLQF